MTKKKKKVVPSNWRIELERKIKWLLIFRLVIIVLIFGAVFLFLPRYRTLFKLMVLYGAVTLGYLGALYYWRLTRREVSFKFLYGVQLLFEIMVEGAIIHYSGGEASIFTFLFALTILSAAFVYQMGETLITATVAIFTYLSIAYLEYHGIIPPIQSPATQMIYSNSDMAFSVAYMQVSFLYIVAFLSGYMAQKIGAHLGEIEETRKELERVQWNTDQILQHMRSGLVTVDETGTIIYYNEAAARILQLPSDKVMGNNFQKNFPARLKNLTNILKNALPTSTIGHRSETTIENRYGQQIPIAIVVNTLRADGGIGGAIVLFEDITEDKKKEELLQQMEKLAAIGELSARLAHELRNPLAAIRGGVEMMKNEMKSAKLDDRIADLIIRESDKLTQILEEFLTFARLKELPPEQFRVETIDVADLIAQSAESSLAAAGFVENIELKVNIPKDFKVLGRKDQLIRVFQNIIMNAIDSIGEEGGKITISAGQKIRSLFNQEELAGISIKDSGYGISKENLSKIFDPFFTTKPKGVGLGLSIVQGIVNQHGGFIEVKSEENEYTEFIIYLPVAK